MKIEEALGWSNQSLASKDDGFEASARKIISVAHMISARETT